MDSSNLKLFIFIIMENDFYKSSGFLSVFRNQVMTNINILNSSLKVINSQVEIKIEFKPDKDQLVKIFTRVFARVLSNTRNAAASRHFRNIYHDKMKQGKQIHQLLAKDYVESLFLIIQKAQASSLDMNVRQELVQNGPIPKLALFIIQYVRNANRTFNVPLTNYYVNLESDCSSVKTTKKSLAEVFDLTRVVDSLVSGDETSLVSINLGHLDKTVPGFCSAFIHRGEVPPDCQDMEEVIHELYVAKAATSFDVSMAILLGMSSKNFDPDANYADVSKISVDDTEFSGLWESVLMDFFYHMLKCDLPDGIKSAERQPLEPGNQWKMTSVGDNETDINTSG